MTVSSPLAKSRADLPFAVSMSGICKRFGAVTANDHIDLNVLSGDIHGIVGENGAGKSTLVSILYGFYTADSGTTEIAGIPYTHNTPADSIAAGIGMVHQHFMLVPNFTVLENIILGHEGYKQLSKSMDQARHMLSSLSQQYGLDVDLDAQVEDLPVSLQQRVEILKALYRDARILILDEPTGVLTPQETNQLFDILRALKKQGVTILLITHKLREIMAATDHVSVMRGGRMIAHLQTADTTPDQLAELMVGRPVQVQKQWHKANKGAAIVSVKDVQLTRSKTQNLLSDITFTVHAGEILGIAGVAGNGQSELLNILAGIIAPTAGHISYHDHHIDAGNPADPQKIKSLGVAHVPEDRHASGIVLPFTAAENAALGYEKDVSGGYGHAFLSPQSLRARCAKLMQRFDVRPADPNLKSSLFSGGNQQKLVLAREMSATPSVLLIGQPTRGVDIGAIEFIHQQLIDMRDKGCAIILVSVELDEIMSLSDRIMVMNNGRIMGLVEQATANVKDIGLLMAGVQ
ncbi:ABC transporter ATP-binding protein [Alphaproteobacteria bacterium]|nr:ABC transporter ATP-binding protein [Alphaproteobacteria bacterium]